MRVLMLCGYFWPMVGGAEGQAGLLAGALQRQGHEVEVLTALHDRSWPVREVVDGLPIHRFPLTDLTRVLPRMRGLGVPNLLIERGQVRRAVSRKLADFDLLHTHIASPLVAFALAAAHERRKPVICKIACGGRGFDFRALRAGSLLGPRLARGLVEELDRWVAISEEVRRDLLDAGVPAARITSIPNGIDLTRRRPGRARGPARRFLCLGRLRKFEFASLFEAFDRLLDAVPDAELKVAGSGDGNAAAALLARHPRAQGRSTVSGFTPAAAAMDWADALVHPSRAEGMSNTLLEAMSVGLPGIASDIPPNREVLGDTGLLVPLGDADALRNAMCRLALEAGLGVRLAEAARLRVENRFSIDRIATRYGALYDELVQRPPQVRRSA
jgi:glycosyltransferase involved in cell wall biosynthesis